MKRLIIAVIAMFTGISCDEFGTEPSLRMEILTDKLQYAPEDSLIITIRNTGKEVVFSDIECTWVLEKFLQDSNWLPLNSASCPAISRPREPIASGKAVYFSPPKYSGIEIKGVYRYKFGGLWLKSSGEYTQLPEGERVSNSFEVSLADPPQDTIVTTHQGVSGYVYFWEGDFRTQAPSPSSGTVTPVQRTLVVHAATRQNQVIKEGNDGFYSWIVTSRIAIISSNDRGFFQVELQPGRYSFFVVEDSLYYANRSDGSGYIQAATVVKDSVTNLTIDITYKAMF